MNETSHLRRYDNEIRRALFLHENGNSNTQLNANIPHQRKWSKVKVPSTQKRQILIKEAFERLENKKFTNDGNLELVNNSSTSWNLISFTRFFLSLFCDVNISNSVKILYA